MVASLKKSITLDLLHVSDFLRNKQRDRFGRNVSTTDRNLGAFFQNFTNAEIWLFCRRTHDNTSIKVDFLKITATLNASVFSSSFIWFMEEMAVCKIYQHMSSNARYSKIFPNWHFLAWKYSIGLHCTSDVVAAIFCSWTALRNCVCHITKFLSEIC
jgi:hypothetical protein